jgi:hypothetical protein
MRRHTTNQERLSIIYSGNIVQADLLKCVVKGQGIRVILQDEILGMVAPWYVAAGGAGEVKVAIAKSDVDKARPIVEEFVKSSA